MQMHRYCCCGGCLDDGANCSVCSDTDELSYILTLSGVTLCGCDSNDSTVTWIHATDINSAHTVTQLGGDACTYRLTLSNAIRLEQYSGAGCTGSVTFSDDYDVQLNVELYAAAGVRVRVNMQGPLGSVNPIFFDDQSRTSLQCRSFPGFTNDYGSGDCDTSPPGLDAIIGYGGTATVTCRG